MTYSTCYEKNIKIKTLAVLSDILCVYFYYYWQALFTLYSGQDRASRDTAHKWLLATQKSQHAWQLCWRLMQSDKVRMFVANLEL